MAGHNTLEPRTQQIGRELLATARAQKAGLFSSRFWSDRMMNWAMRDPSFKVQLFRFIDVYPQLQTSAEVHEVLSEYLLQPGVTLPPGVELGLKAGSIAKGLVAATIGNRIHAMAATFIAGADLAATLPILRKLWGGGSATSVDLLGEACVSQEEARVYQERYRELIQILPAKLADWPPDSRLDTDHLGPIPRVGVSVKLSALDPRLDPADFDSSVGRLKDILRPLLDEAARRRVAVTFDMEQTSLKDLTLEVFQRCCEEVDFPAGLAIQAYLRSGPDDARRIIDWSRSTGRQVSVRLIKGAYWDYEVTRAEQMGWPVPVWTEKRQTDACFERMAEQFVVAIPRTPGEAGVKLALGTHNIRSLARVLAELERRGLPESAVEVQMLYGMADPLKQAVLERGLRLRQYVPVGPLIPGMAYLVRRLLENASNQSWLRAGFFEGSSAEQLLASPHEAEGPGLTSMADPGDGLAESLLRRAERHQLSPADAKLGDGRPFFNEPGRDFAQRQQCTRFARDIGRLPLPVIHNDGTLPQAQAAVAKAAEAFPAWRDTAPLARCQMLVRGASMLRQRRDELAGVVIREAGKPWRDADGDVCEAIDFCEFYARAALPLFRPQRLGRFIGELDEQWHQPRGPAVVISPWNFPMAICAGMTAAALVTGNTVIVKPAEQTPACARLVCEALWRAGVPSDVLQLLPGDGAVVGAGLVRDPRVALIAFTGSKQVGLDILEVAGHTLPEQQFVKKVVCEMGGKNAIIVDSSADYDEAVLAVRQSAFGYAGQKCSACSRLILVGRAGSPFLPRLVEATRALVVGDPQDPATEVGPLIDVEAAAKVRQYIEIGCQEGRLELACDVPSGLAEKVGKPYVGPHIFSAIEPHHRLANEEIFGPVLAVTQADTFEQALDTANATGYRLTGGVFTRQPTHLEAARRHFRVGNLYLNRGITGALVGRQPFGGFGLSGTGTKAGGAEYLLHFVEPRACAENTLRHGFAPGLD